jgi:putative spermidine/putrescine transport system substrate-binding protein
MPLSWLISAAPHLPTAHLIKVCRPVHLADYGESLGEKFNEWLK